MKVSKVIINLWSVDRHSDMATCAHSSIVGGRGLRLQLCDVLFETAASADLGPTKEEKNLLPGTIARPVW